MLNDRSAVRSATTTAASSSPNYQAYPRPTASAPTSTMSGINRSSNSNGSTATGTSSSSTLSPKRSPRPGLSGQYRRHQQQHTHRLYKAPQASFRGGSGKVEHPSGGGLSSSSRHGSGSNATSPVNTGSTASTHRNYSDSLLGSTRRRRPIVSTSGNGFALERQNSNTSMTADDMLAPPTPPQLWKDDTGDSTSARGHHRTASAGMHSSHSNIMSDGIDVAMPQQNTIPSPLQRRKRSIHGINRWGESSYSAGMDVSESVFADDDSVTANDRDMGHSMREYLSYDVISGRSSGIGSGAAVGHITGRNVATARNRSSSSILRMLVNSLTNPTNLIQLLVLLILAGIVYDSHHRVKAHKVRLQQYDEERAHILEQMMWVDQAAKKVHNKYAGNLHQDPMAESKEELAAETTELRNELEELQLRIQLNARDQLQESFGDKELEITLKMTDSDNQARDVTILLSDDTPHAAATLLRQIDMKLWDQTTFDKVEDGVVEVSSLLPTANPLLLFAEKSRGCHEVGSVALHSTINKELTVLVLRIHLVQNVPLAENDVCIGKVLNGLEYVQNL